MQEEKNPIVTSDVEEANQKPAVAERTSPATQFEPPREQHTQSAGQSQAQTTQQQNVNIIINQSNKSVGIALLLTFFFGPLGMFYSTTVGAIVMLIVSVIVGVLTLGIGLLITQPICMIWGAIAASNANKATTQQR